jgi:hypothetical protein
MQFPGHIAAKPNRAGALALAGAGALALAGLTACQEPPSYRLRWALEGREMLDASACAESGLFQMRARVYGAPGVIVDERVYPCFPEALRDPEGTVGGTALPPGRYAIELRGVDRTGDPWDDEALGSFEPDAAEHAGCSTEGSVVECRPTELVCDCQRLEVVAAGASGSATDAEATVVEEGATVELPELVLVAPPQCVDGIDNDRDGLVDVNDPSCNVDFGDGTEAVPVGVTQLRVALTLLGNNPVVTCASVPLRQLRLSIVGETGSEIVLEEPCQLDQPYLASLRLPAGPTTFSVVGVDSAGEPLTVVETFEAEISPTGGTVEHSIDFGPDDFLEPIVREIRVRPAMVSEVGPEAQLRYTCHPRVLVEANATAGQEEVLEGSLFLDRVRVHLLNGHGGPLDAPAALDDGTVLDGPTVVDCETNLELVTEPLEWGSYSLVLEALSAEGEVCFSNVGAPALMSPGGMGGMYLPRVYGDDGTVPASCHDCEADADCGLEGELFCVDNVCQRGCTTDDTTDDDDAQCLSDELGDLGFACIDDACRRAG